MISADSEMSTTECWENMKGKVIFEIKGEAKQSKKKKKSD